MIYKSLLYDLPSFESIGNFVQKEFKIDFQDGGDIFLTGKILAILIYMSPRFFLPTFKSMGLSVQEKKFKIDFQDGGHDGHLRLPF